MDFNSDLELAIMTPHRHEGSLNKPLWLIWANAKDGDGWALLCICDSERACRYNVECYGFPQLTLIVERIPANHAFASSVEDELRKANHRIAATSYSAIHGGYRRVGN